MHGLQISLPVVTMSNPIESSGQQFLACVSQNLTQPLVGIEKVAVAADPGYADGVVFKNGPEWGFTCSVNRMGAESNFSNPSRHTYFSAFSAKGTPPAELGLH